MKIYTKILSVLIISLSLLNISGISANVSPQMRQSIQEAKYLEEKTKLDIQLNLINIKLNGVTERFILRQQFDKGIKSYSNLEKRTNVILNQKYNDLNNLYHIMVVRPTLNQIINMAKIQKEKLISEKNKRDSKKEVIIEKKEEVLTKEEVQKEVVENIKSGNVDYSNPQVRQNTWDIMQKAGFTRVEYLLATWPNFKYCANFTPDIYNEHGFGYYYSSGQQENTWAIDSYGNFLANVIPAWYDTRNELKLKLTANSIQNCVRYMQSVGDNNDTKITQTYVKELYERYFEGETFKVWTTPYYKGKSTEEIYTVLRDIQKYIGNHQGISNYNIEFDRTLGWE